MWPEIQVLFEKYEVPEKDAEAMVRDMLIALLYKWDGITNHGFWLTRTLENRCRRRYGEPTASAEGANGSASGSAKSRASGRANGKASAAPKSPRKNASGKGGTKKKG